jgi:HEAT repeat protein
MDLAQCVHDLNSEDVAVRRRAAERLAQTADAACAAVPLVRSSGDADEQVREWAVAALENLGRPSPEDVASLAKLLQDPHRDVVYWAATLLGRLEGAAIKAAQPLAAIVAGPTDAVVRQRAAWALGRIGPAATFADGS